MSSTVELAELRCGSFTGSAAVEGALTIEEFYFKEDTGFILQLFCRFKLDRFIAVAVVTLRPESSDRNGAAC